MTKLIIITGPTGTGKSEVAVELAEEFNGEIISADSMQVYKYMDIGTAKASKVLQDKVKHHLIDIKDPKVDYNAALFVSDAEKAIEDIKSRGKNILVVGGTGLYIKALVEGLSDAPESDESVRERLLEDEKSHGKGYLYGRLKEVDPRSAETIHENNTHRVIRALEVFELTGKPFSEYASEQKVESKFETLKIASDIAMEDDREKLYSRINLRVKKMMDSGLVEEVQSLIDRGYSSDLKSMSSLGYKEVICFLEGDLSLEDCVELIQKNTRHYAKRQLTWFKADSDVQWLDFSDITVIKNKVVDFLS